MVQVTPQAMRMLGGLLEREVTRDDPEWAAAMASLTVSEKTRIGCFDGIGIFDGLTVLIVAI